MAEYHEGFWLAVAAAAPVIALAHVVTAERAVRKMGHSFTRRLARIEAVRAAIGKPRAAVGNNFRGVFWSLPQILSASLAVGLMTVATADSLDALRTRNDGPMSRVENLVIISMVLLLVQALYNVVIETRDDDPGRGLTGAGKAASNVDPAIPGSSPARGVGSDL